jgi:hypothetical protein
MVFGSLGSTPKGHAEEDGLGVLQFVRDLFQAEQATARRAANSARLKGLFRKSSAPDLYTANFVPKIGQGGNHHHRYQLRVAVRLSTRGTLGSHPSPASSRRGAPNQAWCSNASSSACLSILASRTRQRG